MWVHGGGFTVGRSFDPVQDGAKFAKAGTVCVTVAYRRGVFGFLDLEPLLGPAYAGSANNAVRALIPALTWVKEEIASFGGDPARVTVGGDSAGAKLTDILMGVPPVGRAVSADDLRERWRGAGVIEGGVGKGGEWLCRSEWQERSRRRPR